MGERKDFSINQYQVGRLLGEGAFGEVRLGRDNHDKEFAVKCLSRSFLKKQREFIRSGAGRPKVKTALDDVQREIAIMKKTDHANIVRLAEVVDDEANDMLYIVLELVTGGQAMYWSGERKQYATKAGGVYDEARAKELSRDAIEGLRYLHKQGIIHRDLKPENLLLSDSGSLKIADFGIAQKLDMETKKSVSITNMQGTHQFMSPEMITEKKYDGFLVDVWALGVCLFAFVNGKLPFWGDSPEEVFDAITQHALEIPAGLSDGLKEALASMLDKDPTKRISIDKVAELPWFEFEDIKAIPTVELTEEDKFKAITPKLDFAATARLKVQMSRLKKNASTRSKLKLAAGDSAKSNGSAKSEDAKSDDVATTPSVTDVLADADADVAANADADVPADADADASLSDGSVDLALKDAPEDASTAKTPAAAAPAASAFTSEAKAADRQGCCTIA